MHDVATDLIATAKDFNLSEKELLALTSQAYNAVHQDGVPADWVASIVNGAQERADEVRAISKYHT